ncbi:MAG TPA: DUF5691 domain-containing protein [Accumulibacter sp.]|nr:DUF5691 domain-containing protein [Accumulibacter sp.]
MSSPLQQLAMQALLGSERQPLRLPAVDGPVGALLQQIAREAQDAESAVLRLAGVLALCAEVAFQPPAADAPALGVCPDDPWPAVSDPVLCDALQRIIDEAPEALQRAAFQRLAAAGHRLPPRLLPAALALGKRLRGVRADLLPVLGQRGFWLAGVNPHWQAVLADDTSATFDETLWHDGTLAQRQSCLRALRARDPAAARQRLQEGWREMSVDERLAWLDILAEGSTLADEDFLTMLLGDRSREVRQRAAMQLAALPPSRYVERMTARVRACLLRQRRFFRQELRIEAPESFAAEWKNDALEEKCPRAETLGERAWWLFQLVRALPLAWWPAESGLTPAELVRWANAGDWADALLCAWGSRLSWQTDSDWAHALLADPRACRLLGSAPLLEALPVVQREPYWQQSLDDSSAGPLGSQLAAIVHGCTQARATPSDALAQRVLQAVRAALAQKQTQWDSALRASFPEFVALMPDECLPLLLDWPSEASPPYFNDSLARALSFVRLRQSLARLLPLNRPQ